MRIATVTIEGVSPYGQSKFIGEKKSRDETFEDFEDRVWRERCHYNEKTKECFIPPMCFKNALRDAAQYKSEKIPGEGNAKWTKHFKSGVMVVDGLPLHVKRDDVAKTTLHVPSDGRTGGTKRVIKHFPTFHEWGGDVKFLVLDDKITTEVFERFVKDMGSFIGIGFFRPTNGGYWGRFEVKKVTWTQG